MVSCVKSKALATSARVICENPSASHERSSHQGCQTNVLPPGTAQRFAQVFGQKPQIDCKGRAPEASARVVGEGSRAQSHAREVLGRREVLRQGQNDTHGRREADKTRRAAAETLEGQGEERRRAREKSGPGEG